MFIINFRIINETSRYLLDSIDVTISYESDPYVISIYAGMNYRKNYIQWLQRFLAYVFYDHEVNITDKILNFASYITNAFDVKAFQLATNAEIENLQYKVTKTRRKQAIRKHLNRIEELLSSDFEDIFITETARFNLGF